MGRASQDDLLTPSAKCTHDGEKALFPTKKRHQGATNSAVPVRCCAPTILVVAPGSMAQRPKLGCAELARTDSAEIYCEETRL